MRGMGRHHHALIELISSVPIDCWASGPTGAALFAIEGYSLRPPFHLTIERGHNLRRIGHHIHTTNSMDRLDRDWADGVPVCSPSRILLQLAEFETRERMVAALESALRDGLTSEEFLHRRLAAWRVRGRGGVRPLLRALEGWDIGRGGQSWLEREFLRIVHAAGLPTPMTQQVLGRRDTTLIRVDCHFPEASLVVELLGYRWHRTPMQMQVDSERVNQLQMKGQLVLQFTYRHVTERPEWVVHTVAEVLHSVASRNRPAFS